MVIVRKTEKNMNSVLGFILSSIDKYIFSFKTASFSYNMRIMTLYKEKREIVKAILEGAMQPLLA